MHMTYVNASTSLLGVATLQAWLYFRESQGDGTLTKIFVCGSTNVICDFNLHVATIYAQVAIVWWAQIPGFSQMSRLLTKLVV